jgi:hypothetical protein
MGQLATAALVPAMATGALLHGRRHHPLPLRILVPSSCRHHFRRAMPHTQRFFPGFLMSPEHPVTGAVPLGAATMRGQHAAGHHGASRGHH